MMPEEFLTIAPTDDAADWHSKLVYHAPYGIAVTNEHGRLELVNPALCAMLGYRQDELLGQCVTVTIPPENHADVMARLDEGMRRRIDRRSDIELLAKDGRRVLARSMNIHIVGPDGRPKRMHFLDNVTDKRHAETALQESENRFRAIFFDQAASGMALVGRDGFHLLVNQRFCDMIGYTAEELKQTTFRAITHPDDLAVDLLNRRRLRAGLVDEVHRQKRYIRKDGSVLWVNLSVSLVRHPSGEPNYFVAVIEDISQQKQAEESQAQLAALVTSSDDAIFSRNLDGIITSWNQAAEMLYGYHAEEVIGKPVSLLIPPDRQEEAPAIRERVNRGEAIRHFETVRLRKDGRLVDVSLTMSPMKDASGTVIGGSTIARDITERKRAEKERAKLLAREQAARAKAAAAEEANRLKSQFLANMSHELRTPLHAIIGFAEMMYDERAGPVSDTYKDFLGEILDGSRHLLQLINDLLDLSKIEAGKMELVPTRVDVDAAAAHVIESLRPLSGPKRITVVCDVEPPVTVVETDERQLKQIFYNYLSNAIKYTPDEGTVTVRVREADGDRFRIEVEDTGVGIASEHLPKLFHDFQQLDSSTGKRQQGTGLGLALIKRIVEAQGGRAGVSSVVDQGSCFYAELPRRLLPG